MAKKPTPRKKAATATRGSVAQVTMPEDGTLPLPALLGGYHARRKTWAPGRTIYLGTVGGRGGTKLALMMVGSRSGDLPWKREDDADLLADDWEVIDPAAGIQVDAS